MYLPAHFREDRLDVLHEFIERHPLGALVVSTNGELTADHLPMLLVRTEGPKGTLHGHVARGNAIWKSIAAGSEVLVIFGGANAYVSPSWSVDDAPAPYVQAQLRAIVGFEIEILDIVGKFKASQNKSDADRAGIRDALEARHVEGLTELVRSPNGALPESGARR